MFLQLSEDQESFRSTTVRFLADQAPVERLRRQRDDEAGFLPDFWRRGAELGWTSLLVDERYGGGSLSGEGLLDLTVVAYEFGRHAAPGPLVATNVVAGALSRAEAHEQALADLLSGAAVAGWCVTEGGAPHGAPGVALQIRVDGDDFVVDGTKWPVESAAQAGYLLVTGRTGDGLTQLLVPRDAAGVTVTPMATVDLTRRFGLVTFAEVRVPRSALVGVVGGADTEVARQWQHAVVMVNAEAVGAMQAAFDMTVRWADDRYSFGRPLASYQALKHRFADMATWLQASHAICDESAEAVAAGSPDADELLSAAKSYIGDRGGELMQDCVQLHGGIGLTFEHDLHLFLRRLTVDRTLFGTPSQHRQRLTDLAERKEHVS